MTIVGVLHPGSMGAAVAAQVRSDGPGVLWCTAERSSATQQRAARHGLTAVRDLREVVDQADVILSICPPAHAEDVVAETAAHSFSGTYVDANAISPATMARVAAIAERGGATVVDGSIVGSPPSDSKSTRLYLSGPEVPVAAVAGLFDGSAVRTHALVGGVGRASALKLAYSSYQKTSRVLAAVSYALARDHGVEAELLDIASGRTASYLAETDYIPKVAARAWRWGPEMAEAAETLREAGLPAELAEASAAVMNRWDALRDSSLGVPEVLEQLHDKSAGTAD
ncbi:NAD(P)-dependent oxidoreductase [Streptomyces triticagri]|uniref:NAD(P)-dependent oxidoreductase n=1 Tax=Streptomyces triticagri TaxID=2293568 RepID=A0A372LYC8_9ACTN|nr:DUF1932 domain-containing protein [Streptomyces triticagri]RFU83285.1 NAD(P)-dependent oxidoreductase [Streptomyces triticagri]